MEKPQTRTLSEYTVLKSRHLTRHNHWSYNIFSRYQRRICFVWNENAAEQVEIVDYH